MKQIYISKRVSSISYSYVVIIVREYLQIKTIDKIVILKWVKHFLKFVFCSIDFKTIEKT